tara:strand:+ start:4306 stop:4746 length:441 start_codon:yes stop_codon:yes gene_type:complete
MKKLYVFALFSSIFIVNGCTNERVDEDIILQYISDNNLDAEPTGSGLYYVINTNGNGNVPNINSIVTVAYKGTLTDGTIFDQSDASGLTFPLTNVIQGWQEGIPLFSEGGSGILLIPSALGYGNQSIGNIPANSVLIFEVTLINVD